VAAEVKDLEGQLAAKNRELRDLEAAVAALKTARGRR
jgi:hypothetical protein